MTATAQQRAVSAVRQQILSGELAPGVKLVQEDLADRLGVSRIPLREALQMLASEGLLSHEPHRGYFVTELSVADLEEVYQLRQVLETEAISAAIPGLTDADVATLQELAREVERAAQGGSIELLTSANRRFHFALFDAAGMPRLSRLLHQLWDASDAYRSLYFQQDGNRQRVEIEHDRLVAAVAARDAGGAIRIQNEHRDHSVAWVRSQLLRTRSQ